MAEELKKVMLNENVDIKVIKKIKDLIAFITDEKVKVSLDDTIANYLISKIIAQSSKVVLSENNPAANETLGIDIVENQINHDSLLNYDALRHFLEGDISHLNISNIGTNSHIAIDSHVADNTIHFLMLDQDDMADNSDTKAATQQSIKAYIDNHKESGTFVIADQLVAPLTDYTLEITLGAADFTQGFLNVHMPNDVSLVSIRRLGAFIQFDTVLNNAVSKAVDKKVYDVYGYNFDAWHLKGYWYDQDSKLSETMYRDHGGYVARMYIKSCKINGNKIELVFTNPNATYNGYLTVEGGYQVFR